MEGTLVRTGVGGGSTAAVVDSSEGQTPPSPGISSISIASDSAFIGRGDSEGF